MATHTILNRKESKEVPLASEGYVVRAMPTILGAFDMTAVYLVAIFFIVNAATAASGGAAAFTFLILGAVTFFIPCAIATAQLGHMFPNEGSLYNWTHKALGGYWSFFIGFCAWFPGVLVIVAGSDIVISFIQGLNSNWLVAPWQQGLAIIGLIAFSGLFAVHRLRVVQNVVNVMVCLIGVAVLLVGLSGFVWLVSGHHSATNFANVGNWNINWSPSGNAGLPAWTQANRPIENTILTGWYVLGVHHIARTEEWPVMPVKHATFMLRPNNFFKENPALDVPPPSGHDESCEHHE